VELEALDAARERRAADTKVAPVAWAVRAGVEWWKRVGSERATSERVEARAPSGWTRTGPARGRPLAGPRSRSRPPAASK